MVLEAERAAIVAHARRLRRDGLVVGTSGNLSARAGEYVAITPSGVDYDELTPQAVCVTDLDGRRVEGELAPSTELPMHLAVHRRRAPGAIVHTHSPFATALAAVVDEIPAVHYLFADLGGPVRVARYATFGTDELAESAAAALGGDRFAVLLRNHGTLTIGDSVAQAYARSRLLEELAALYHRARLLGEPHVLDPDELARVARELGGYGQTA